MYNQVNLKVSPSRFLQTATYLILILVLAVSIFQFYKYPVYLIPILLMLGFYAFKLHRHAWPYQQYRTWQINNGRLRLLGVESDDVLSYEGSEYQHSSREHSGRPGDSIINIQHLGQPVNVLQFQVWQPLLLFTYELNGRKFREIITVDAVDHEAFRRFRCMIKQLSL